MIHLPAGRPLNTTLPVGTAHVGWLTALIIGAVGDPDGALMMTFSETGDVHPSALVTVNPYEPGASPVTLALAPDPSIAPGLMIHFPEGNPFNATLPVGTSHVG